MNGQTVRVFLMNGGAVDVLCCGFNEQGGHYVFTGPVPEDKAEKPETVAQFNKPAVAGFLVLDTQHGKGALA